LSCSYQVPKEVGKVGTESSTFIEPISNRKDGIQAMFSKQRQSQNKLISKISPFKRPRSNSPTPGSELVADRQTAQSDAKKRKAEENDAVVIDSPSTLSKVSHEHQC
jgi:hypothetical protein